MDIQKAHLAAFLKGMVIKTASSRGMKYICNTEQHKDKLTNVSFQKGFNTVVLTYGGYGHIDPQTILHIVYNQLRHYKPHTNRDEEFLAHPAGQWIVEQLTHKVKAELGADAAELLKNKDSIDACA